jgi:hypothetical protein
MEAKEQMYDEISNKEQHGKYEQIQELGIGIEDEVLEAFLVANFNHLKLTRTENQDIDVSLISLYTSKKFIGCINIFSQLKAISLTEPCVLPPILNIVGENSPAISLTPLNFKGKLYPPQAAMIKRMLDLEETGIKLATETTSYEFNIGLIAERLSFGKTYCLPALICERFRPYVSNEENVIPTNLVIAGSKVAKEWKNNLKKYVDLDFMVIETAKNLKELSLRKDFPQILVVKDGDITYNGEKLKAIEHINKILAGKKYCRVILDDFDMLKLGNGFNIPDALFTWLISGTVNAMSCPKFITKYITKTEEITATKEMNTFSHYPIIDSVGSIYCNKDYSSVEYNIPKIDSYMCELSLLDIVKAIFNNINLVDLKGEYFDKSLINGTTDVPYIHNIDNMKILVSLEDKQEQLDLITQLNNIGISAVKLTRGNISKFERESTIVGVAGNLFGVNMGFLTHIVVDNNYDMNTISQIVGRGQRLSRKQNLQVYFNV